MMVDLIDRAELLKNPKAFISRQEIEDAPKAVICCAECKKLVDGFCQEFHYDDGGNVFVSRLIRDEMFCGLAERRTNATD